MGEQKVLGTGIFLNSSGKLAFCQSNLHFQRLIEKVGEIAIRQTQKTKIRQSEGYDVLIHKADQHLIVLVFEKHVDVVHVLPIVEKIENAFVSMDTDNFEDFFNERLDEIENPNAKKVEEMINKIDEVKTNVIHRWQNFSRTQIINEDSDDYDFSDEEDDVEDDEEQIYEPSRFPPQKVKKKSRKICCSCSIIMLCAAVIFFIVLTFTGIVFYYVMDCFGQDCVELLNSDQGN